MTAETISFDGVGVRGFALGAPVYDTSKAINVMFPSSITVPVGASVRMAYSDGAWPGSRVSTNDPSVLAPSDPATNNGFVAVATGSAVLTGSTTQDGTPASGGSRGSVLVTVVPASEPAPVNETKQGFSTGAVIGVAAAGAVVIGGFIYLIARNS